MRHQHHFVYAGLLNVLDKLLHMVFETHARSVCIRLTGFKTIKGQRFRVDSTGAQPLHRRFPDPATHPRTRDENGLHGFLRHDYTRPFSSSHSFAISAAGNCSLTLRLFKETRSSGLIAAEISLMISAAFSSTLSLANGTIFDDKNKPFVSSRETKLMESIEGTGVYIIASCTSTSFKDMTVNGPPLSSIGAKSTSMPYVSSRPFGPLGRDSASELAPKVIGSVTLSRSSTFSIPHSSANSCVMT